MGVAADKRRWWAPARPSDRHALNSADTQPVERFRFVLGPLLGEAAGAGTIVVWMMTSSPVATVAVFGLLTVIVAVGAFIGPRPADVMAAAGLVALGIASLVGGSAAHSWLQNRPPGSGRPPELLAVTAAVAGVLAVWWILGCPTHIRGPHGPTVITPRVCVVFATAILLWAFWIEISGALVMKPCVCDDPPQMLTGVFRGLLG